MEIETLNLDDVQLLRPNVYKDNRGFFTEILNLCLLYTSDAADE